jgi:hypothetical protein
MEMFFADVCGFQNPTTMPDSQSPNTSFIDVVISSRHKYVFIHNLGDLDLSLMFDPWWASRNMGWKG